MPKQYFTHVETWVFALANTLYPPRARLFDQIEVRMTQFVMDALKVGRAEADTCLTRCSCACDAERKPQRRVGGEELGPPRLEGEQQSPALDASTFELVDVPVRRQPVDEQQVRERAAVALVRELVGRAGRAGRRAGRADGGGREELQLVG